MKSKKHRKPKKHVPQHIYCETYQMNYYVSRGVSEKQYRQALKRIMDYDAGKLFSGQCLYFSEDGIIWIWTRDRNVPNLTHEVLHAVFYTLCPKGIDLTDESQEAFTYQIGMLMRKILENRKN